MITTQQIISTLKATEEACMPHLFSDMYCTLFFYKLESDYKRFDEYSDLYILGRFKEFFRYFLKLIKNGKENMRRVLKQQTMETLLSEFSAILNEVSEKDFLWFENEIASPQALFTNV